MMKPKIKPRNPFVASVKFRKAGPHGKTEKSQRRHEKVALVRAVKQWSEHCHERSVILALLPMLRLIQGVAQ